DATTIRFTNFICHSGNITNYPIHTCRLKAVQRNKIALYYNGTLNIRANRLTLHFQFVKKANGYKPWLHNYTVDFCDYLRRRNNPILNMLTNAVKDYGNLVHPCPFEGPLLMTGLYLTPRSVPVPFPTGEYGVLTTWKFHNIADIIINVYFEFIEDL
ncbi:hypothetical protein KR044_008164, partial [Drosophila immigrans]